MDMPDMPLKAEVLARQQEQKEKLMFRLRHMYAGRDAVLDVTYPDEWRKEFFDEIRALEYRLNDVEDVIRVLKV